MVSLDLLDLRPGQKIGDLRGLILTIAIDAAVSLLENHQGPRYVEVDQAMAEVVKVESLRGHVCRQEKSDLGAGIPELLHDGLLIHVREASVKFPHLLFLQLEVVWQMLSEKGQRLPPLREDDESVLAVPGLPLLSTECIEKSLILAESLGPDRFEIPCQIPELLEVVRKIPVADLLCGLVQCQAHGSLSRIQDGFSALRIQGLGDNLSSKRSPELFEARPWARKESLLEAGLEEDFSP